MRPRRTVGLARKSARCGPDPFVPSSRIVLGVITLVLAVGCLDACGRNSAATNMSSVSSHSQAARSLCHVLTNESRYYRMVVYHDAVSSHPTDVSVESFKRWAPIQIHIRPFIFKGWFDTQRMAASLSQTRALQESARRPWIVWGFVFYDVTDAGPECGTEAGSIFADEEFCRGYINGVPVEFESSLRKIIEPTFEPFFSALAKFSRQDRDGIWTRIGRWLGLR